MYNEDTPKSLKRDVYRRRANRMIREMNDFIAHDEGFKGRFYAHQEKAYFSPLDDRSGAMYGVVVHFIDRETGKVHREFFDLTYWMPFPKQHLWRAMNKFVTEKCGATANLDCRDYRTYTLHGRTIRAPHSAHPDDAPIRGVYEN